MEEYLPLATRMRPDTLDDFLGQEHLVSDNKFLKKMLESGKAFSLIFWGPPGTGKTTLARIIASSTNSFLEELSATSAGVAEVREIVKKAEERLRLGQPTILFIDEIHRFSKAQQDRLLPYVENGQVILIGATTENPSFYVISPLLSRCRVLVLKSLSEDELREMIQKALSDKEKGLGNYKAQVAKEAEDFLIEAVSGDARLLLNTLEIAVTMLVSEKNPKVTLKIMEEALQKKALRYDKKGDEHYDVISAFIKSMRASQADAAIYYLARMIEVGEDPRFIARRMVIFASEDIGLAQPTALVVANEVFRTCEIIGLPECAINLAHGVAYLCRCKKDRSAYNALREVQEDIREYGNLSVPLKLRNATTKLMESLDYGKGYEKYDKESYLPEKLKGKKYF